MLTKTETIQIEGMSCAGACVRRVKSALEQVKNISVEEVALGSARVSYEEETTRDEALQAIRNAGFTPISN